MKREFLITEDGSVTIHLPEWNEQYHSKHGAIAEAQHVFIQTGLHDFRLQNSTTKISILEIGFGTGLNAFLTHIEAEKHDLNITYTGVEAFPVIPSEIQQLNYAELLGRPVDEFMKLHDCPWETAIDISPRFSLIKQKKTFGEISEKERFDLIFFDAFGPRVQPELWTEGIFLKMLKTLKPNGVLVTYSAKGSVRRNMQAVGFTVERLPGPPSKREMLRATKHLAQPHI